MEGDSHGGPDFSGEQEFIVSRGEIIDKECGGDDLRFVRRIIGDWGSNINFPLLGDVHCGSENFGTDAIMFVSICECCAPS